MDCNTPLLTLHCEIRVKMVHSENFGTFKTESLHGLTHTRPSHFEEKEGEEIGG